LEIPESRYNTKQDTSR